MVARVGDFGLAKFVAQPEHPNQNKSTVSFNRSTTVSRKESIAAVFGLRVVDDQEKYLGLPTVLGHSKKSLTNIVREKLRKKLLGWRGLLLSKAGREVLIKAIAQSIPIYAMSIFKLPAKVCDELRSLVSRFWVGTNNGNKKIPWVAWSKMCLPKCKGRMVFRDFRKFNMALLGKHAWRLMTDNECLLSRVMRGKYYPDTSFLDAELGRKPSYS
ncbi:hypothetical protein RND81_12G089800 [Saponaria officinalis]|uniref:Reverse transcriptase n=1 Tax=Saponaria officinalis TaxID=3572 RepID=A0AAW1H8C0_SAPOF